jgi:hypothetical protein
MTAPFQIQTQRSATLPEFKGRNESRLLTICKKQVLSNEGLEALGDNFEALRKSGDKIRGVTTKLLFHRNLRCSGAVWYQGDRA